MSDQPVPPSRTAIQVDVSAGSPLPPSASSADQVQIELLKQLQQLNSLAKEQLELTRQMVVLNQNVQQQRQQAVKKWRKENPYLTKQCAQAVKIFEGVHKAFLSELAEHIMDNGEDLVDAEFVLNEFVDRFGPRLIHVNSVMNLLQNLGGEEQGKSEPKEKDEKPEEDGLK